MGSSLSTWCRMGTPLGGGEARPARSGEADRDVPREPPPPPPPSPPSPSPLSPLTEPASSVLPPRSAMYASTSPSAAAAAGEGGEGGRWRAGSIESAGFLPCRKSASQECGGRCSARKARPSWVRNASRVGMPSPAPPRVPCTDCGRRSGAGACSPERKPCCGLRWLRASCDVAGRVGTGGAPASPPVTAERSAGYQAGRCRAGCEGGDRNGLEAGERNAGCEGGRIATISLPPPSGVRARVSKARRLTGDVDAVGRACSWGTAGSPGELALWRSRRSSVAL